MRVDRSAARSIAALMLLAACGGGREEQPAARPQAETAEAAEAAGPVENLEPAPPPAPEPSHLGTMPLLRPLPFDARCVAAVAGDRIVMEGDIPTRTVTVGLGGSPTRAYPPTYVEIRSHQARGDGQEENESIHVNFGETGAVESGRREYFLTGSIPTDASSLRAGEGDSAKAIVAQAMERCWT